MTLRRAAKLSVADGVIGHYVHASVAEGLGKIGVIVGARIDRRSRRARAARPPDRDACRGGNPAGARCRPALDPATVERERAVLREKNAGKPANVLDKIVESGLKTYYKEVCLTRSGLDPCDMAARRSARRSRSRKVRREPPIALAGFVRYALGEGVDKTAEEQG